jgi:hypothetical protein
MTRNARPSTSSEEKPFRLRWAAAAAAAAALTLSAAPASAAIAYDEAISGDLSNNGLVPTVVTFSLGSNVVQGTTGHPVGAGIDRDYFTFTVQPGSAVTAINLLPGTTTINLSFIGIEAGSQLTLDPATATTAAGLLGWTHYSAADVGTDILDNIGAGANGATGFSGPLGPGSYAVWIQEASTGNPVSYAFDFVISQAPEPSTWMMMLAGFGLMGIALRRRRSVRQAEAWA